MDGEGAVERAQPGSGESVKAPVNLMKRAYARSFIGMLAVFMVVFGVPSRVLGMAADSWRALGFNVLIGCALFALSTEMGGSRMSSLVVFAQSMAVILLGGTVGFAILTLLFVWFGGLGLILLAVAIVASYPLITRLIDWRERVHAERNA